MSELLAWVVVALFAAAALLESRRRNAARVLGAGAWTVFAVFWAVLVPQFLLVMNSAIEGVLSIAAVPACAYAGFLLWRGRDSMFLVTRAVAFMGVFYLPFSVPPVSDWLIEVVAAQVYAVVRLLGYAPAFSVRNGVQSELVFTTGGEQYATFIVFACTGLGSMAIFAGAIAAVRAPLRRKLRAAALALPTIYVLNIVRNVFIAVGFGRQWFQMFVPEITGVVGYEQPGLVSFFIADRVIAQAGSVVALVAIAWVVSRELPELLDIAQEALYALTGSEVDLGGPGGPGPGGAPPDADSDPESGAPIADGGD
jgi:archaeosortase A (PGF-CTERM-specific)